MSINHIKTGDERMDVPVYNERKKNAQLSGTSQLAD